MQKIVSISLRLPLLFGLAAVSAAYAQVSSSAYRVLGQSDLLGNGLNQVRGTELNAPSGIALDTRGGQTHIYISDRSNSRVLGWADIASYQVGDAPSVVLGQPGPQYIDPQGIGAGGFNSPLGMAVDPSTGNLYVADFGNNRVLRFPSPFNNLSRVEPDAVFGQPNLNTTSTTTISSSSLNQPRAVAFDTGGNLWVADSGNNRVLRFAAATLNSSTPPAADTVIGQNGFQSGSANAGAAVSASGLNAPAGLTFDSQGNLYVADAGNSRVLRFNGPFGPSVNFPAAAAVWGQSNFASGSPALQASASTLGGPIGIAVDNNGNLYVAASTDNRLLQFATGSSVGAPAKSVWGQTDFTTTTPNTGAFPQASPNSLSGVYDVKLDVNGNLFVADTGNNRVLEFPAGAKAASKVWGQSNFTANGPNQIKPTSINYPYQIAIDYSQAPFALYVSDTGNNRVLVWKDSVHFQNGDPADLVIGQPNLLTGAPNVDTQGSTTAASATSLWEPAGIAVAKDGTVYVADLGNNRILRYPRPVSQNGRITPNAVIGQSDFTSNVSALVGASSLKAPSGLAIGPTGDLFVADSGNNRVLEFPAGAGNGASALRVYGQPNMNSSAQSSQVSAQTLSAPRGIALDQGSNLYVADTGAKRVLIFPNTQNAPASGMTATFVIGAASFSIIGTQFKSPVAVAVDTNGSIYISDSGTNRVLVFQSLIFLPVTGANPTSVVGQQNISGINPNWDSLDGRATADSLFDPAGVYIDRQNTLYVGDAGNSRVLQFLKPAIVENAATFQASVPVGQGSISTLFGNGLASDTAVSTTPPWQLSLLNRQIVVNDQTVAPIFFINSTQANFQMPSNAPLGSQRIAVRTADTGELVAGGPVLIQAAGPGIFTANSQGSGQGSILNQDQTVNSASNPAPVGTIISIYGTGQGQVSPGVQDGAAAPSSPLASTIAVPTSDGATCLSSSNSMCVAIGSTFGIVKYSGLAPGFVGLWQINVQLPQGVATGGSVPLRVVIDGSPSNTANVAIR